MTLRIAYYPEFSDAATLADRYWRAVHYLSPVAGKIKSIEFSAPGQEISPPPIYLDPDLPQRAAAIKKRMCLNTAPAIADADVVVVWDKARRNDRALIGARKVVVLDPTALHEGDLSIEFGAEVAGSNTALRAVMRARLVGAIAAERQAVVHVFGSGPSIAALDASTLPEGVTIVCNSLVKDVALMARLRPRFVTAVDPIFHAGPSRHAAAFRAALIEILRVYRPWFVVQERDVHLYCALLPEALRDLIIAVPVRYALAPNFDWKKRFFTTATRNVLTLTLLPIAAQLGSDVRIYGCDGRPVSESDHFWSYAPSVAFSEELALQRAAHPGFFKLDFQDYYALHCETVRRWIVAAERRGTRVWAATPSGIPALNVRALPGVAVLERPPLYFTLFARIVYLRRLAQSAYGAVLTDSAAPGWLKSSLRAAVRLAGIRGTRTVDERSVGH